MGSIALNQTGVVTAELSTPFENAFLYIANSNNLPKWTVLFKEASENHAILETPDGPKTFGLVTHKSFEHGIIEWFLISEQGHRVDQSYSRLHRLPNGYCAYSFMFMLSPMPGECLEDAEIRQTQLITTELKRLQEYFNT
jgi:hypothetical protein